VRIHPKWKDGIKTILKEPKKCSQNYDQMKKKTGLADLSPRKFQKVLMKVDENR
jgi:hypothetical protein